MYGFFTRNYGGIGGRGGLTRSEKDQEAKSQQWARFLIHFPKVRTTFAAWFGSVVQWIVCGFPEPKMQVRFLPGLQIRGAMHLSGKTASSRKRRGGFLLKTETKSIFSIGGIFVVYIFLIHGSFLSIYRARHGRRYLNPCSSYFGHRPSCPGVYPVGAFQAHF